MATINGIKHVRKNEKKLKERVMKRMLTAAEKPKTIQVKGLAFTPVTNRTRSRRRIRSSEVLRYTGISTVIGKERYQLYATLEHTLVAFTSENIITWKTSTTRTNTPNQWPSKKRTIVKRAGRKLTKQATQYDGYAYRTSALPFQSIEI